MKQIHLVFLFFLIVAVGIRIYLSFIFQPLFKDGENISFETTLLNEPSHHGHFDTVTVYYSNGFGTLPIYLALPVQNQLHYGQTVAISGKLKVKALGIKRTITTISMSTFKIENGKRNLFLSASFYLRHKIQIFYEKVFSQQSADLLLGIVLGVKGNFTKSFLQDLQAAGVMHVIAASGMNVTLVSGFLLGLFTLIFKRQWAIALTIAGLLFYCMLSGLQASILRATIMLVFALGAQLFGRQYSGLYGLFLAAGSMLLYNPTWIGDVGFQLSFAATLGIFFFKPMLPQWKIITDDIGTTISAQLATLPILIGSFGSYGLLSVVVNALVLWTIPPLMVLGGVGGLIGLVLEPLGKLLLYLCIPLLWFFEKVVTYFGSFNLLFQIQEVPFVLLVGYYCLLFSWVLFLRRREVVPQQ